MIRTILAAALALAVTACSSRDTSNWGSIAIGVGHVVNADAAASNGAAADRAQHRR